MNYFTLKEAQPSEKTLQLIRQIARLYPSTHANNSSYDICMN